ncbi:hypothetical protein OLMES_5161 [Oleiphilus messinensis]|uniref:Uncharacterized protein n=1 Tax=Oleiphilus messinensis TaxID=141451 RepID=A0A1Y0II07_9GAMM|nr:hypothetical protein [Oleiphilus messinensis]ARU59145.1 hypothetical protein OLMES_5161 [Oleiphilus messinensis]
MQVFKLIMFLSVVFHSVQVSANFFEKLDKGIKKFGEDVQKVSDALDTPKNNAQQNKPARKEVNQNHREGNDSKNENNIYYSGYSRAFKPVKALYSTGNLQGIDSFYRSREERLLDGGAIWSSVEKVGLLRWMERGTLYLDQGNKDDAIRSLANAEMVLELRSDDSELEELAEDGFITLLESVTGMEEFSKYPGEGFEKVLMLNYKSIAYLLNGDRKAYNVTRRAIDWQDIERRKFDAKLRAANQKLEKEREESSNSQDEGQWASSYNKYDKIANQVSSAYVNPFGYYVAGMVQDFESRKDGSLRANARISYEKALGLNPNSEAIEKALSDIKNRKLDNNIRLLHVVVANGFAPERKVLEYGFDSKGRTVPIKLPIYEPVESKVKRIELKSISGKHITTLTQIANIEAITMRHQKDSAAFRNLKVLLSVARAIGVNTATKKIPILGEWLNSVATPDTRSWMSLPAEMLGARVRLLKRVNKIRIVSYDQHNRVLSDKVINLDDGSDNFVYARSVDDHIYANSSRKLWTF